MKGKAAPAVIIAVFNQLQQLNGQVSLLLTLNDLAAQKAPEYAQINDFLTVSDCNGKPADEVTDKPKPPPGWPAFGTVELRMSCSITRVGSRPPSPASP